MQKAQSLALYMWDEARSIWLVLLNAWWVFGLVIGKIWDGMGSRGLVPYHGMGAMV